MLATNILNMSNDSDNSGSLIRDAEIRFNLRVNNREKRMITKMTTKLNLNIDDILKRDGDVFEYIILASRGEDFELRYILECKYYDNDTEHHYLIKVMPYVSNEIYHELIHEAWVGSFAISKLPSAIQKYFLPVRRASFSQTVLTNIYPKSKPFQEYIYLVYDYVEHISYQAYVRDLNFEKLKRLIRKIIDILHQANEAIEFTHYDLHTNNIIIADDEPLIIDYEFSHVKINGKNYSYRDNSYGINDRSCWFFDVIKFLLCNAMLFDNYYVDHRCKLTYSEPPTKVDERIIVWLRKLLFFFFDMELTTKFIIDWVKRDKTLTISENMLTRDYKYDDFHRLLMMD